MLVLQTYLLLSPFGTFALFSLITKMPGKFKKCKLLDDVNYRLLYSE